MEIKIANFRISEEGHPELYEALKDISHKARAERLRSLADIGLMVTRGSLNAIPGGVVSSRTGQVPNEIVGSGQPEGKEAGEPSDVLGSGPQNEIAAIAEPTEASTVETTSQPQERVAEQDEEDQVRRQGLKDRAKRGFSVS